MSEWNLIGHFHHACAWLAIFAGAMVFLRRKGTTLHRRWGYTYFTAMLALNVSALTIYRLFGGFGVFHVAALVSLATIVAGLVPVVRRRPAGGWLEMHAQFMAWSYVGLMAAAVSEAVTRMPLLRGFIMSDWGPESPGARFGIVVGVGTSLVVALGAWPIHRYLPGAMGRAPASGVAISTRAGNRKLASQ